MTKLNTSAAIVEGLIENNVDTVFGLPGAQMYDLFDAFYKHKDKIKVIGARHEQGLAYMAFGYASSSGKLGVFCPVPGPGVLNTTAALCTALGASKSVLCLTGEVPTSFKGQGRGHLHELPDQLSLLKGVTKWAAHVEELEKTPLLLNEAIGQACSGRPGPVSLQLCWNDFSQEITPQKATKAHIPAPPVVNEDEIAQAVNILKNARAPMIFVGSGAQHASKEIAELAELLEAPVVAFRGGRGIVGDDKDLSMTIAAAYKVWPETDVIIGIGTRLEIPFMRWGNFLEYRRNIPGKKLIRLDIDATEMPKLDNDSSILADSVDGTRALIKAVIAANIPASGRGQIIADMKSQSFKETQEIQPQTDYLKVIRDILPRDGFLVDEVCQMGFATPYAFPVYEPLTFVSGGYQGNLGFGFPTALGVKVANPKKAVISIAGDGGFMFGVQELATAAQHNIAVIAIVFNNSAFGNVRRDQMQQYDGKLIGSELQNPDFVKLAESFGVISYRVHSPTELKPILEKAIDTEKPVLIEVIQERGSEASPWKYLMR